MEKALILLLALNLTAHAVALDAIEVQELIYSTPQYITEQLRALANREQDQIHKRYIQHLGAVYLFNDYTIFQDECKKIIELLKVAE